MADSWKVCFVPRQETFGFVIIYFPIEFQFEFLSPYIDDDAILITDGDDGDENDCEDYEYDTSEEFLS